MKSFDPWWLAALVLSLVSLVVSLSAVVRLRRWGRFLRGTDAHNLEGVLLAQQEELTALQEGLTAVRSAHAALLGRLQRTVQTPRLLRFNAYADTGSDLSFSLALLDGNGDGVVLSSLFGRDAVHVYAKPVEAGRSRYPLTEEEQEAILRTWTR